jgi:hypothetical protein
LAGVELLGSDGTAPLTFVSKRNLIAFMVHRITLIVILKMPDPLRLSQIAYLLADIPRPAIIFFSSRFYPTFKKENFSSPWERQAGLGSTGVV